MTNDAPFQLQYGPRDMAPRAKTLTQTILRPAVNIILHNQVAPGLQLCRHCREVLPVRSFGDALRLMPDGVLRSQPWCKECRFKYASVERHKPHPDQLQLAW